MICNACHGRRRPCNVCAGYRVIIGPARNANEQHRVLMIVRTIGLAPHLNQRQR